MNNPRDSGNKKKKNFQKTRDSLVKPLKFVKPLVWLPWIYLLLVSVSPEFGKQPRSCHGLPMGSLPCLYVYPVFILALAFKKLTLANTIIIKF